VRDVQVAVRAAGGADADGFIGKADVKGIPVSLGVNGNGGDLQFLAGADHAQRNFTSIGDENLSEHKMADAAISSLPGVSRIGIARIRPADRSQPTLAPLRRLRQPRSRS